jgi:hypothetical protein
MTSEMIFRLQLGLGYAAWLLALRAYGISRLRTMDPRDTLRAVAMLHSFRFFGLVFILPGVVSPELPTNFATAAAYGDFATGVLAMLALLTFSRRALFLFFTVAFNLVGIADLLTDYYHATAINLPAIAGYLGAAYAIPILYVPLLMMTHGISVYLLIRILRGVPANAAAEAR